MGSGGYKLCNHKELEVETAQVVRSKCDDVEVWLFVIVDKSTVSVRSLHPFINRLY